MASVLLQQKPGKQGFCRVSARGIDPSKPVDFQRTEREPAETVVSMVSAQGIDTPQASRFPTHLAPKYHQRPGGNAGPSPGNRADWRLSVPLGERTSAFSWRGRCWVRIGTTFVPWQLGFAELLWENARCRAFSEGTRRVPPRRRHSATLPNRRVIDQSLRIAWLDVGCSVGRERNGSDDLGFLATRLCRVALGECAMLRARSLAWYGASRISVSVDGRCLGTQGIECVRSSRFL